MPFLIVRVSVSVSRKQKLELKTLLGRAIEFVPGKSEEYLLVDIKDDCCLFVAGSDGEPVAYLEASVFGNECHAGYAAFSASVTTALRNVLDIKPERIYLRFTDISAWAVAGRYFDRQMFC